MNVFNLTYLQFILHTVKTNPSMNINLNMSTTTMASSSPLDSARKCQLNLRGLICPMSIFNYNIMQFSALYEPATGPSFAPLNNLQV